MFTPTTPTTRDLGDSLILKSISTHDDIERLAAFNASVHDEDGIAPMTRALILHHPCTRPEHWLFVEDATTGKIVSSLALIPWRWQYEDVTLKAGEMGIVGTDPAYRRRGLIRALDRRFKELLRDEACHLSQIQGIPYFYRQFGYEYAIPLIPGWRLEPHEMPDDLPPDTPEFTFRQGTVEDAPAVMRFDGEANREVAIHAVRDEAIWRYLLDEATRTATVRETWLVIDPDQRMLGYCRVELGGFGTGLNIDECSPLPHPAALRLLLYLKRLAAEHGKPYICFNLPEYNGLVQVARSWGAHTTGHYAWQILIPDVPHLLRALAPVLERRIAGSSFAGLTRSVRVNTYREAYEIRFVEGEIVGVESLGCVDGGDVHLPPPLIAPLLLGYRTWRALRESYPDVSCWGQSQPLIDTLFPTVRSFIHTMY